MARFGLEEDLSEVFKKQKFSVKDYKQAVYDYKNSPTKERKAEVLRFIDDIKKEFVQTVYKKDARRKQINNLRGQLMLLQTQNVDIFGNKIKEDAEIETIRLEKLIAQREAELENAINSPIYRNAFEWRFEFPEVLDEEGKFVGFDAVVGNPPYVFARGARFTDTEKKHYYSNYKLASFQINMYPLFIEEGDRLLSEKGILSFIVPNNWLTVNTNKDLRSFILQKSNIIIVNFLARVFDSANVDTSIIIYDKEQRQNATITLSEFETKLEVIKEEKTAYFLAQNDFIININSFKNSTFSNILDKIDGNTTLLKDISDVKAGLKTYEIGAGKPPQSKEMKENRVFHSKHKEGANYYPYLEGKDVCRYYSKWSGEFLNYGKHLSRQRVFELFSTKRILVRQIPSQPPYCINACLMDEVCLNDLNSMNIINITLDPKYVLSLLNSRLISFWFIHKFGKMQRGIFPQFKVNELENFPIRKISETEQQPFVNLVEKILSLKSENPQADTQVFEDEIDELVFGLYGLSAEERAVVLGG